jgi:hypothetical protein
MEIESALVAHPKVAEAAVVSKPHEIKGESAFAYVVLNVPRPQGAAAKSLIDELRKWVGDQLSPIARPDEIRLTDNLPKTRSGKIMRRLLRAIARGEEITQDVSTLENPAILEQLRGGAPAAASNRPAAPAKRAVSPKSAKKGAKKTADKQTAGKTLKKTAKKAAKRAPKSAVKAAKRKVPSKSKAAPRRSSLPKRRASAKRPVSKPRKRRRKK